jgi:hypothetical protein
LAFLSSFFAWSSACCAAFNPAAAYAAAADSSFIR